MWPFLFLIAASMASGQSQPTEHGKATYEGQVVNTVSGEPVRNARLTLRRIAVISEAAAESPQQRQPELPPITVGSDATGKFAFTNLEPGAYELTARREGFANAEYGLKKNEPIVLNAGDHKVGQTIKMTPFGVITGRAVDRDGDPIRGITVAAMTYQYTSKGRQLQESRSASTNDLGEYRIFDLPRGKYFVKTVSRGLRVTRHAEDADIYAMMFYPGVEDAAGASALEVIAGREVSGIEFTLRQGRYATIRGRLVAPPGATNLSVGLMTTNDSGTSTSTTNVDDKDGKFEMVGVAAGPVYLVGSYVAGGQRHSAQIPLQVASSDITGIELHPLAPMDVGGQVRIEGQANTKPSRLSIGLQGPGRSYGPESGGVSEDGRLIFRRVEPNTYRVTASGMADLYLKSVQWGPADVTDGEIDLSRGVPARTELSIVLGSDGGQLEGVVENEKLEPAASCTVVLAPITGHRSAPFFKTVTADTAGRFTIKGIAPGAYKIYAYDQVNRNAVIYDPDFLPEYDSLARKVELSVNEKKSLDLKLIVNKHGK